MIHPAVTRLADKNMTLHRLTDPAEPGRTQRPGEPGLAAVGRRIAARLREHFDAATLPVQQVLAVAEEAGEFTAAYRRWAGLARRPGPWDEMAAELADVVLVAYVTAAVLGIDLDAAWQAKTAVIFARGWREPPPAA